MGMDVRGLSLPWKHLQPLKLEIIVLDESKLVHFLVQHQPTLSLFEAEDGQLENGTWKSLKKRLKPYFPKHAVASSIYTASASNSWPLPLSSIRPDGTLDDYYGFVARESSTPVAPGRIITLVVVLMCLPACT